MANFLDQFWDTVLPGCLVDHNFSATAQQSKGVTKPTWRLSEFWFKFGLFGWFWMYFDRIKALNYFQMMIYLFVRAPKTWKITIFDVFQQK